MCLVLLHLRRLSGGSEPRLVLHQVVSKNATIVLTRPGLGDR